ncbi:MAG: NAD kinase [Hyphomicrobiales bacterium]
MSDLAQIAFVAGKTAQAQAALDALRARHGDIPPESADIIVALGGDGLMLRTLHRFAATGKSLYGMNCGSVGFLMNNYGEDRLPERLARAEATVIHPLRMRAADRDGRRYKALAFNEVSLLRESHQAAKLRIRVDGRTRLEELICDGVLTATPAGSTAYNLSVHGPILPIAAPVFALTPISAFRPRRWRGAILPREARLHIEVLDHEKRPVAVAADHAEFRDIIGVDVEEDRGLAVTLLFDPGHSLAERILNEQFSY